MTKDSLRQSSECRGKMAFLTQAQAEDNARDLFARYGYVGRIYACEWCDYWHVGQLGKKKKALP